MLFSLTEKNAKLMLSPSLC